MSKAVATAPKGGPDGKDVEDQFAQHLEYLRRLGRELGVPDLVDEYFTPVLGRWSDLHAEAEQWRAAAADVETVTDSLDKPLAKLDEGWNGAAADSFVEYMQQVGLAGQDLSEAMTIMGQVLDDTADGIREIVTELGGVLAETAESSSQAMAVPVQGDERTRQYLDLMRRPVRELFESARQVMEAFADLCGEAESSGATGADAFAKVTMDHPFPAENWTFEQPATPQQPPQDPPPADPQTDEAAADGTGGGAGAGGGVGGGGGSSAAVSGGGAAAPEAPPQPGSYAGASEPTTGGGATPRADAPAAASGAGAGGSGRGGAGMPMMPMMPMGGGAGGQGGDSDHKNRNRLVGDPTELFGKPEQTSAPIIGSED
jgi:WXG100 family type VII secretion target